MSRGLFRIIVDGETQAEGHRIWRLPVLIYRDQPSTDKKILMLIGVIAFFLVWLPFDPLRAEESSNESEIHPLLVPHQDKGQRMNEKRKKRKKRKKAKNKRDEERGIDGQESAIREANQRKRLDQVFEESRTAQELEDARLSIETPKKDPQGLPVTIPKPDIDNVSTPTLAKKDRSPIERSPTKDQDLRQQKAVTSPKPEPLSNPARRAAKDPSGPMLSKRACTRRKTTYARSSARKLYRALTAKNYRMRSLKLGRSVRVADASDSIRFQLVYEHDQSVAGLWSTKEGWTKTYVIGMTHAGPVVASHTWPTDGPCAPSDSKLEFPQQDINQVDVEPFDYWALRVSWLLPNDMLKTPKKDRKAVRKVLTEIIQQDL